MQRDDAGPMHIYSMLIMGTLHANTKHEEGKESEGEKELTERSIRAILQIRGDLRICANANINVFLGGYVLDSNIMSELPWAGSTNQKA